MPSPELVATAPTADGSGVPLTGLLRALEQLAAGAQRVVETASTSVLGVLEAATVATDAVRDVRGQIETIGGGDDRSADRVTQRGSGLFSPLFGEGIPVDVELEASGSAFGLVAFAGAILLGFGFISRGAR